VQEEDLDLYDYYGLMALKQSTRFPYHDMEEFMFRSENLSHGRQLRNDAKLIELLKLLETKQKLYNSDDHLEIGHIYFDLMEIYYVQKKWEDAITSLKRASDIMEKYFPDDHPDRLLLNLYKFDIARDMHMETSDFEAFKQFMSINQPQIDLEKYEIVW
jgi:hypothetical protein